MCTVEVGSAGPARTAVSDAGRGLSAAWCTAVLSVIAAATRSWLRAAHVERDDPAPVMADRHDLVGFALRQQCCHDGIEVGDPVGDPADARVGRARCAVVGEALGEAHVQVVRGR